MFFKGRKAVKDLTARAGRGEADAEFALGERYSYGKGVKRDLNKAFGLYEDAAKHGSAEAMLKLGERYLHGCEDLFGDFKIERDGKKAAEYFEAAINSGAEVDDDIRMTLGEYYRFGEYGVEEDIEKTLYWLSNVKDKSRAEFLRAIADAYYVAEDRENALHYAADAAKIGGKDDWCSLGAIYHDFGDIDNAIIWYKKAADAGDDFAMCSLGEIYLDFSQKEIDAKKAEQFSMDAEVFFIRAAKLGNKDAEEALQKNFKQR